MQNLVNKVLTAFKVRFGSNPIIVCAPGRVNLIGEHTDYNNGFVLPASIDKVIILAMAPNNLGEIRLQSLDLQPQYVEITTSDSYQKQPINWANYILGVVDEIQKAGNRVSGFDCVFSGNLPIGAGMSSSAALEGGIAFGLSQLLGIDLTRLEMTKISQRAENNFVGVQCGIMDQFASLHGKNNRVIKLDCRSLEFEYFPFIWDNLRILLCDTKVRRTLAGSEYNVRRAQCEKGVSVISKSYSGITSLRDVSLEQLANHKNLMDEVIFRRCKFILNENKRVEDACSDLIRQDLKSFGNRMYQSHYGLRDNYEVSCTELDILVDATEELPGILGSRMMGGGFGGCTINLVDADLLDESVAFISKSYEQKTGTEPGFHIVKIGSGTHLLKKAEDGTFCEQLN